VIARWHPVCCFSFIAGENLRKGGRNRTLPETDRLRELHAILTVAIAEARLMRQRIESVHGDPAQKQGRRAKS
jgi:hypothetical protein